MMNWWPNHTYSRVSFCATILCLRGKLNDFSPSPTPIKSAQTRQHETLYMIIVAIRGISLQFSKTYCLTTSSHAFGCIWVLKQYPGRNAALQRKCCTVGTLLLSWSGEFYLPHTNFSLRSHGSSLRANKQFLAKPLPGTTMSLRL